MTDEEKHICDYCTREFEAEFPIKEDGRIFCSPSCHSQSVTESDL